MDLAEHDALHGSAPEQPSAARPPKVKTAEVWRQARALHPAGTKLTRLIDLDSETQLFQQIPETELNFMDGATIVRSSTPGLRSARELDDIFADYDARFLGLSA